LDSIDLSDYKIILPDDQELPLANGELPSSQNYKSVSTLSVYLADGLKVPPSSEMEAMGEVRGQVASDKTWVFEPVASRKLPVVIARAIVKPHLDQVPLRLVNTSASAVTLYSNTTLGTLEESIESTDEIVACTEPEETDDKIDEDVNELMRPIIERNGAHLTEIQKDEFLKLLITFSSIFAATDFDLGQTDKLRHHIDTDGATPIRQSVRRISPIKREEVQKLLKEMLKKDVIQRSSSPWAAPIVLVKKKDGSTRFCVDYRKLNLVTRKDAYPLPRIDSTLDTLSGSQWFSTIDMLSGYWQVKIADEDRPKTAFGTTEGLFEFKVMPFGLCNAPATFQRLMDLILAGMQWSQCLVYIDDVVVVGRTFEEHLQNLQAVFLRLKQAGLKIKPSKSVFFQKSVRYLGYLVTTDGIQPDPDKVNKVTEWPVPSSVREVQQFIGFASYYRRFVKDFSTIARPLHQLSQRGVHFNWSKECNDAFSMLRVCLSSSPVLAYPDFSRTFTLDTDASDKGIGAVLSQLDDEGRERVIVYGSHLLTKPERRYCVTRRELLAAVFFIKQFRSYLYGREFILRTDHGSLQWLRNFKEPEGQLARWLERLQEFNFKIIHRQGKKHTNADALSRLPCPQCKRESHMKTTHKYKWCSLYLITL
jgi:hypothetical protein